ncbi:hypothetical protein [Lentilactobacillus hilgardii]|uniref:hypothetical protein n=1 Tax=Lentilactobacillus hilgardii TaxID=1588 RepID=UPI00390C9A1D
MEWKYFPTPKILDPFISPVISGNLIEFSSLNAAIVVFAVFPLLAVGLLQLAQKWDTALIRQQVPELNHQMED